MKKSARKEYYILTDCIPNHKSPGNNMWTAEIIDLGIRGISNNSEKEAVRNLVNLLFKGK